jgi:hypothetical protein
VTKLSGRTRNGAKELRESERDRGGETTRVLALVRSLGADAASDCAKDDFAARGET